MNFIENRLKRSYAKLNDDYLSIAEKERLQKLIANVEKILDEADPPEVIIFDPVKFKQEMNSKKSKAVAQSLINPTELNFYSTTPS